MDIILHRANKVESWMEAIKHGWGIEVDIRSYRGQLYLAHDPIEELQDWMPSLRNLTEFAAAIDNTVILDFKESGWMRKVPIGDYYHNIVCTDLIVPDHLMAAELGIGTLCRRSQYENIDISLYKVTSSSMWWKRQAGYWVDYVSTIQCLHKHASVASQAYVVSPELHGHQLTNDFIQAVKDIGFKGVCTDYPRSYS